MSEPWRVRRVQCARAVRIIPSHFPPIDLFEEVADPADLESVFAVEALTNPRLREQVGELSLVAPEDRIAGEGSSPVMAAFTHLNPEGSRFSDGSFGVYYAAFDRETAIAETVYHRERILRFQDVGRQQITMRCYVGRVRAPFVDLRGLAGRMPDVYSKEDYRAGQAFGRERRSENRWGIVWDSVRRDGGTCVGVFRPKACAPVRQAGHLIYYWNGERIETVAEVRELSAPDGSAS